jgi:MFS family permease
MSRIAESFGAAPLSGPYAASAFFFSLGALLIAALLHPDPRDVAREIHRASDASMTVARSVRDILAVPQVRVAGLTMALSQLVMVMLMVITSLHMSHHDHPLSSIAAVMSSHVFGMYAFSIVSGRIADTFGRGTLIGAGASILVIACLTATLSTDVQPLAVALFLLGLGWNFCYVGGSTLLSDCLSQTERARIQSINDFVLTTLAGTGSVLSGFVFSGLGYAMMGYVSAVVSLLLLALSLLVSNRAPHTSKPSTV